MSQPSSTQLAQAASIPSIDRLLQLPAISLLVQQHGHTLIAQQLRLLQARLRQQALGQQLRLVELEPDALQQRFQEQRKAELQPKLRPVINLTGTVLHTNLGRALLPEAAVEAVVTALTTPANLEFDIATGQRGDRDDLVEELLCELTGAEAATIVNNNAAAVLLMLSTLAQDREVIV